MEREILNPTRKALKINLNGSIYGCFAEIGGGQEVARHFFQAGGASGTVAKTISAYDKAFSDALYESNSTGRYVSELRLTEMLQTEYKELTRVLEAKRGITTQFFSFANTVRSRLSRKSSGWRDI